MLSLLIDKNRLVIAAAYRLQVVYVTFIGTHRQHDKVDAHSIEPG